MTDDAIRIAIAECCGYSVSQLMDDPATFRLEPMVGTRHYYDTEAEAWSAVPNYPADLNACAEMEKTLDEHQQYKYHEALELECRSMNQWLYHATARQRCEAFLRVKGLWKSHPILEHSAPDTKP